MGTSKSNSGPKGKMPLLPPWAPPPEDNPQQESSDDNLDDQNEQENNNQSNKEKPQALTSSFSNARRNLTKYVKSRSRQNFNNAASSYVNSYGGANNIAQTALSGKSSGIRFSDFISGVANQGINSTLKSYGLSDCIGESAEYVLTKIADVIAPAGGVNEEAAAREAIIDVLAFLYENFELNNKEITELDSISKSNFELVIKEYVSSYIFNRWLHELGLKFEEKAPSTHELVDIEIEAKAYIKEAVKLDLSKINLLEIDFNSGRGKEIIDDIFKEAYIFIETL